MSKRIRVQTINNEPSMTQQHMKDQCDVNSILEKYRKTGIINHTRQSQGSYGDFSQHGDFRENFDKVIKAQSMFDALPSPVRKRFANDPALLIEFLADPKNKDEAVKLGLAVGSSEAPQNPPSNPPQNPPSNP